jgi:hypothetical protein
VHVLLSHGGKAFNVEEDEHGSDLRHFVQLPIAATKPQQQEVSTHNHYIQTNPLPLPFILCN